MAAAAVGIVFAIAGGAFADNLQSDAATSSGVSTISAGGSTTVTYTLIGNSAPNSPSPGDPTGCDATVASPVTVTINRPSGVTGSPASVSFTACGPANTKTATFSSNTAGSYSITHSISGGIANSLFANQANFTLTVNAVTPTNTAPSLNLPSDITAEAASAAGAVVNYSVTASDAEDNPDPTPSCSPASGTTFAIGVTQVNCSVTDTGGLTTNGHFNVTVQDTTAPTLSLPPNITAEATSSSGAAVNYTATAIDAVDGSVTVNCSPASGSTFVLGTTTVNCSATDAHGNTAHGSSTVAVVDTTAPVLSGVPANQTVEATGPSGASATWTDPTATDTVDGSVGVSCSPASGSTFAIGTTTVTCSATDSHGNTGTGSFTIKVVDTTPPTVSSHANITGVEATGPSGAVVTFAAPPATDAVDGSVGVTCTPASGSTFAIGTTTVTCSATDSHGNTGSSDFTVQVVDTTPPVIAAHGDVTAEATGPGGAVVSYSSPTASDIVDLTDPVTCTPAAGTMFVLGSTTISCSATDSHGNTGHSSFKVTVVDMTPPTLTLPADITAEATSSSGASVSYSATASDLVDGSVSPSCTPPSGSTFALGQTTVSCTATDSHHNTSAPGTFKVTVVDTTPPTLSLPANFTAEATGPTGAAVSYTATASDLVDGSVSVNCSPASGSTFALDTTTTVNCSAHDVHGNTATGSFTVSVVDTTGPSLNLPANITTTAATNSGKVVTYTASATDLVDGSVAVTCTPASGSTFSVGTTTVNCSATDSHSNTAHSSFTVTVNYNFTGFFQPVDNLPTLNSVKAGSAVPVKFSLSGNQGLNIFTAGYPTSNVALCDASASEDLIEATVTAGNSSLNYDATADQYVYVWKTDKAWAGSCRQLRVKLADGSLHAANFKLTK
jgi:predicted metallo-beta-lactamase superfamily hydrolase